MKNNLKGFLIGALVGLIGSILYLEVNPTAFEMPGIIATAVACALIGYLIGNGIKVAEFKLQMQLNRFLIAILVIGLIWGCEGNVRKEKVDKVLEKQNNQNSAENFIKNPNFSNLIFISDDGERKDILRFKNDGKTVIWELNTNYGKNESWVGNYSVDNANSTIAFNFPTSLWYHSVTYKFYKDSLPWDSEKPFITLEGLTDEAKGIQKSLFFYGPKNVSGENDLSKLNR